VPFPEANRESAPGARRIQSEIKAIKNVTTVKFRSA
jgi:hypothetical protein